VADIADRAEEFEASQRDNAIERITHRTIETPLLDKHYHRICRDCEEVLDLKRIAAAPHAVRCVLCQTEHERQDEFRRKRKSPGGNR